MLLLVSCAPATNDTTVPAATPANFIEIRLATEGPSSSSSPFAFRDSTVHLREAVISDADITAVATQLRENALQMMLYPTDEADRRLYQATRDGVGQSLALVVGGEARSVVRLRSALGGGGMLGVGFAAPDSVAQRLAAEIADRFPAPEAGH